MSQLLITAKALFNSGRSEEALSNLSDLGAELDFDTLAFRSQILAHLGKYDLAVMDARRALSVHPADKKLIEFLVKLLFQTGRYEECLDTLQSMIKKPELKIDGLMIRAKTYSALKKFELAAVDYEKLSKLLVGNAPVYYNYGSALFGAKNYKAAVRAYKKARAIKADLVATDQAILLCHIHSGDTPAAEQYLRQLPSLQNISEDALCLLSKKCLQTSAYVEGAAITKFALTEKISSFKLTVLYLSLLKRLYADQEIIKFAKSCAPALLETPRITASIAEAYCRVGNYRHGLSLALKKVPHCTESLFCCFPLLATYANKSDLNIDLELLADEMIDALSADDTLAQDAKGELALSLSKLLDNLQRYDESYYFLELGNKCLGKGLSYNALGMERYYETTVAYNMSRYSKKPMHFLKERPNIIFVVGMPRSGTSLVEQILDSHSMVIGHGELPAANVARREIEKKLNGKEQISDEVLKIFRKVYVRELPVDKSTLYCVDKMPMNFWHVGLLAESFPNAKFIHCRRSEIETCFSIYRQSFIGQHNYSYSVPDLRHYYSQYLRMMAYWDQVLPERIYSLEYENLVSDIELELANLFDFIGLDVEPGCFKFHENSRRVKTASKHQVNQSLYKGSMRVTSNYPEFVRLFKQAKS
jgi:tetratricopeptide (TPR) repeat protein